jgi:hypothetical protein
MTNQTWRELAPSLSSIIRNNLLVVLTPSSPVGESQISACRKLTTEMRAEEQPYLASATPVKMEFWLIMKHKADSDYRTSFYGKLD